MQFQKKGVRQRTLTGEIKTEKQINNKEVDNQITGNKATTLKGKKGEHFPSCKYHQKTNHLEVYCWIKNAHAKNTSNLATFQDFVRTR